MTEPEAQRKKSLEQLLDDWESAREDGIAFSPEQYCVNDPQLLAEFQKKIAAIERIEAQLSITKVADIRLPADKDPKEKESIRLEIESQELVLHATGGLGAVYRCQDEAINRRLAVKFVRKGIRDSSQALERFLVEARITGALDHPGVVPVYGIGETDEGEPFYVMRFVKGQTLAEAIDAFFEQVQDHPRYFDRLEFRDLLTRFVSVCRTVAFAHRQGVLHRDLKPQNILLGRFGETLVADWGLACYLPEQGDHIEGSHLVVDTQFRNVAPPQVTEGTPAFMSPEQHMGCSMLTPESDVYALGVILFRLVTGGMPCDSKSSLELQEQVIAGSLRKTSEVRPRCPKVLEKICDKSLALEIDDRYRSAEELADDVEAYMGGHATSVYREPVWQQCLKFAVAHRFSAYGIVASVFLLALIAAWFPLYTISRIEHSREVRQLEQAVKNQSLENLKNLARETARNIELATQNYDLQLSMIRNSPLIDELAQASTSMNLEQRQIQLDSSLRLSNGDVLLLLDEPGNPSVAWQVKSQDTIEQSTEIDPTHHEDLDLRVQGSNDKSRTWSTLSLGVSDSASMPRLVAAIHNTEESSPIQLVALIGEPESRLFPSPAQLQQRQGPALFMFVQLPSKKRSGYTSYFETYVDPKSSIDRQREFTSLRLAASNPLGIQLTEGYAEWLNQPAASRGDFFEAQGTGPVSAELEHNYSAWKALVYPLMERQSSIAEDNPLALVLLTPQ